MMNEWLNGLFDSHANLTTEVIITRLLAACLFGFVVCAVHYLSFGRRKAEAISFGVTLVLLSNLVAMTTLIIGNNQALAFSLVGTLAIVRFRTTMDDTRDTAFVIFAVAVGMGSAVGAMRVVLVGTPIIIFVMTITSLFMRRLPSFGPERLVLIRMSNAGADPSLLIHGFEKYCLRYQLMGVENVKNGETIEYHYMAKFKSAEWLPAVAEWKLVQGVTGVEVKGKN